MLEVIPRAVPGLWLWCKDVEDDHLVGQDGHLVGRGDHLEQQELDEQEVGLPTKQDQCQQYDPYHVHCFRPYGEHGHQHQYAKAVLQVQRTVVLPDLFGGLDDSSLAGMQEVE